MTAAASTDAQYHQMLADADLAYRLATLPSARRGEPPGLRVDGDPFDPRKVPYLLKLYNDWHPNMVVMKGAQLGFTVWAIVRMIEGLRSGLYRRGGMYGFPTQDEAHAFAKTRYERARTDNPGYFRGLTSTGDNDSAELKRIAGRDLYFRGVRDATDSTKRPTKLLSFPADALYFDERDDMDPEALAIVLSRLDSSEVRHILELGHPSVPGYGIAASYEESDQQRWLIKCAACSEWTCLEDEFPGCIEQRTDGRWFRACRKCHGEIRVVDGEWVPMYKDREKRGYWASQLLSWVKPLSVIMAKYEEVQRTGEGEAAFWNLSLARSFMSQDDGLDREHARSLFHADKPQQTVHRGPSFLGADVGAKKLHVWIGQHPTKDHAHYAWIGEVESFTQLADLGKKFAVQLGVIDTMAEVRSVSDFVKATPWAWGCRYDDSVRLDYDWNAEKRIVTVQRTASLDASHRAMMDRRVSFRRYDDYAKREIVEQLVNLVRVRVQMGKREEGKYRYAWHHVGVKNDHHRHALNYAQVAATRVGLVRDEYRRSYSEPLNPQAA